MIKFRKPKWWLLRSNWSYPATPEFTNKTDVKPGLTVKGQRIPDTVQEWQYLAELYAKQIEADKLTIAQLKQRINKLERRGSHTKPSLGQ